MEEEIVKIDVPSTQTTQNMGKKDQPFIIAFNKPSLSTNCIRYQNQLAVLDSQKLESVSDANILIGGQMELAQKT